MELQGLCQHTTHHNSEWVKKKLINLLVVKLVKIILQDLVPTSRILSQLQ